MDRDLTVGMEFDIDPIDIHELTNTLEQVEVFDPDEASTEELADFVHACKCIEKAAENARKEHFEPPLEERVEPNDRVGDLTYHVSERRNIRSDQAAMRAIENAGGDPTAMASVRVTDFVKEASKLGVDASEYINTYELTYFKQ